MEEDSQAGRTPIHEYDVVIIGGGLTGLRASLQFSRAGIPCAVISKVHPLRSHSVAAQGGMNAALGNVPGPGGAEDSWERHAYDTVKGSDFLADQNAVVRMCQEAPKTVIELEHMGTVWSRLEDGKIAQRPFGGAGFPRTCYAADRTGHNVLHTLYEQVTGARIPVFEEFYVTSLVTDAGRCTGCTALEIMTGLVHGFAAKAVLMATGGFGRIFSRSTNALINTGDGQALAYRAGAPLEDMEFVQFHPTTLVGTSILISEAARGEGGHLLNNRGERFMARYAPQALDLAPRDVVARAIEQEIAAGRGFPGGYVHLDLRHLGADLINERLPGIRQIAMDFAGVDPVKEPIPIQPGQHYSMGGIAVGIDGQSGLPGLHAAGECACVSVHGANRLGGNSLLETVVFGRLAAEAIARDIPSFARPAAGPVASEVSRTEEKIAEILGRTGGKPLFPLIDELRETMYTKFGIFREERTMQEGLLAIRALADRMARVSLADRERAANIALVRYLGMDHMLTVAESVALGAIGRKESRGSHTRRDYPARDDERFMQHTIAAQKGAAMEISYTPVILGMFNPEERVY
ncbi:MAG TPA: FAD-dependent oxidoreductase [Methanoregula sp.]|nr:FAD-dependent oxidoreductase [Methanoregula sp.]